MTLSNRNIYSHYHETDRLGRYYTMSAISDLLISQMVHDMPNAVVDLGSGSGSLSSAAAMRWNDTQFLTVDIDCDAASANLFISDCKQNIKHKHITADALSPDLPKLLGMPLGSIDAAICNPPYTKLPWRKQYAELLEDAGLSSAFPVIKNVHAEIVFLAQNLRLLRNGGQIGLIVPDSLINSEKTAKTRRILIDNHQLDCVIKLPRKVFVGTEAQAHILILSKNGKNNSHIKLMECSEDGALSDPVFISPEEGIKRLDYSYFSFLNTKKTFSGDAIAATLNEIGVTVVRGKINSKEAKLANFPIFHTSNFIINDRSVQRIKLESFSYSGLEHTASKNSIAQQGDILLARVGRSHEKKLCIVTGGNVVITDCVYRLRVPNTYRKSVIRHLASERGRIFLKSISHGVGASHISKKDLLEFSIYNMNDH